jgi:hypothetical protein
MTSNTEVSPMGDWLRELADARVRPADLGLDPDAARRQATVRQALRVRREAEAFERRWPASSGQAPMVPAISWDQLERQLADLTGDPLKAAMARDLVSATRKTARFKPPEMVLREILCLAWALLDEGFQPESGPEPAATP